MKLRYTLPLYSLVPALLVFLVFAAGFWIFDFLRYITCEPWEQLPAAPERVVKLIGTVKERLYVKTLNQEIYCYETNVWENCKLPTEIIWSENKSGNARHFFRINDKPVELVYLTRQGNFGKNHYLALMKNGDIWMCSMNLETELAHILSSGAFLWLLIPIMAGICSVIAFLKIFADEAQIVFWDFFGCGKRL
jgi:hypothetical protein